MILKFPLILAAVCTVTSVTSAFVDDIQNSLNYIDATSQNIKASSKNFTYSIAALVAEESDKPFEYRPLPSSTMYGFSPMLLKIPDFSIATGTPFTSLANMYLAYLALTNTRNLALMLYIENDMSNLTKLRTDVHSSIARLLKQIRPTRLEKYESSLLMVVESNSRSRRNILKIAKAVAMARDKVEDDSRRDDVNAIFGSILTTDLGGNYVNVRIETDHQFEDVQRRFQIPNPEYRFVKLQKDDFVMQPSAESSEVIPAVLDHIEKKIRANLTQMNHLIMNKMQKFNTTLPDQKQVEKMITALNNLTDESDFPKVIEVYRLLRETVGLTDWKEKDAILRSFEYFEYIAQKTEEVATLKKTAVDMLNNLVIVAKSKSSEDLKQAFIDALKNIEAEAKQRVRTSQPYNEALKSHNLMRDTRADYSAVFENEDALPISRLVAEVSAKWNSTEPAAKLRSALTRYQILKDATVSDSNPSKVLASELGKFDANFSVSMGKCRLNLIEKAAEKLTLGLDVQATVDELDVETLSEPLEKLGNFSSRTLYTELVRKLPRSVDDLVVIRRYYDRFCDNNTTPSSEQVLEFDAALKIAHENADKEVKSLLEPMMDFIKPNVINITNELAENIEDDNSGSTTNIWTTLQFHGAVIIKEAYDGNVKNTDKILKFAENIKILNGPEDRLLVYSKLLDEMSEFGHFGSEEFLRLVFQIKDFKEKLRKPVADTAGKELDELIGKIPRNIHHLIFYGDEDDKKCTISNMVFKLNLTTSPQNVQVANCTSGSCSAEFFWRFGTEDGGRSFNIYSYDRTKMMVVGVNVTSVCTTADNSAQGAKKKDKNRNENGDVDNGYTVILKEVDQSTAGDKWKIVPVEDAMYLHMEAMDSRIVGGLQYVEKIGRKSNADLLISVPARSNNVYYHAFMEVNCMS